MVAIMGCVLGIAASVGYFRSHPVAATLHVSDAPVHGGGADAVDVAATLGPAVGTIIARQQGGNAGLGSGFVIAHDNRVSYLLTNNHVVEGSNDLHVVMPSGHNLAAGVVGTDKLDDLAVVSVPETSLPVAVFASSSQLKVGQAVIAIGSPLGNEGSVTKGVISALHRTISAGGGTGSATETLEDVMQTDASINRGNSGGPLADVNGRVVGVNVAIAGDASNIGFSIPSDLAEVVAEQLIAHQAVQHPFLGVGYLTSIEAIEAGRGFDGAGVLVTDVRAGTPASKAGFQSGDVLTAVDGIDLANGETLGGLLQRHRVDDTVHLSVRRGGKTLTLVATLTERPGE